MLPPSLLLVAAALFVAPALGATVKTTRVSVSSGEKQADDNSFGPASISAAGRLVAFESFATNLVRHDTNGDVDVFVRDRKRGRTQRVSLNSAEQQGNNASFGPSMSGNGRFVAFYSDATNLVPTDGNNILDVFMRDRKKGKTARISIATGGGDSDGQSYEPSISADGRYIAFASDATNLVPNDSNNSTDIFVRDRAAHTTTRVSVSSNGDQGDSASLEPAISADGRFVTFTSQSVNLVGTDSNAHWDVFVHNLGSGKTTRVSVASNEGRQTEIPTGGR